jgi:hypothetical protein
VECWVFVPAPLTARDGNTGIVSAVVKSAATNVSAAGFKMAGWQLGMGQEPDVEVEVAPLTNNTASNGTNVNSTATTSNSSKLSAVVNKNNMRPVVWTWGLRSEKSGQFTTLFGPKVNSTFNLNASVP